VDGDGVGYRTLPGTNHPKAGYFTRGSGHNEQAQYTEREDDYINNMDRLAHKFEVMRKHVPEPVVESRAGAASASWPSAPRLRGARKLRPVARRVRRRGQLPAAEGYPFTAHLLDFIAATTASTWWIRTATRSCWADAPGTEPDLIAKLRSVRYYGGLPLDARTVTDEIVRQEGK
jgi:2-oxoglutarate/2-oxoacid ferredoxin oxidoreductase subunit alpha